MAPLFVLLGAFITSLFATKYFVKEFNYAISGRVAMSVMLLFTAIGHFAFTEGMVRMMPDFIPLKKELVYMTGIIAISAAIGLQLSRYQHITAWLLIIFFLAILPVNINAAAKNIDFQTGAATGPGITYLWFRVPLQIFFIGWTCYFGVRLKAKTRAEISASRWAKYL